MGSLILFAFFIFSYLMMGITLNEMFEGEHKHGKYNEFLDQFLNITWGPVILVVMGVTITLDTLVEKIIK